MADAKAFSNYTQLSDLNSLVENLEKDGFAVLANVFSEQEIDNVRKNVLDYLASKYSVVKADDFEKLSPIEGGLLHYHGISLIKDILDIKTDDRVIEPFKRIWNDEDLTMSLDGIAIIPPREKVVDADLGNPAGFHLDQGPHRKEKCCIQGFINMEHIEDGDSCLSVLSNSHKFHKEFFEHFGIISRSDWFVLNERHYNWYLSKGCEWKKILAPKGSIVFWDSRTVHKGTDSVRGRAHPDRWRFVVYVCYTPRKWQTKEDGEKKKKAYIENRMTSHWPYGVSLNHKLNTDNITNSLDNLTEKHKKCIGIE